MQEDINESWANLPTEISPDEVKYLYDDNKQKAVIGVGSYGVVYKARCRELLVAVKVPRQQQLTDVELENFKHEVEIMRRSFHTFVVLFLGACTQPGQLMLVTEYMSGGNLEDVLLNAKKKLTTKQRLNYALDAALAMNWLHGINNIVHRDLKPANLLINDEDVLKVSDFGFGVIKRDHDSIKEKPKGTVLWMAPEIMQGDEITYAVDVYAYGLILWEIITRGVLFEQYETREEVMKAVIENQRPPLDVGDIRPRAADLMQQCWSPSPQERPSFAEILPKLNHLFAEYLIEEEEAQEFWLANFLNHNRIELEVDFQRFLKCIATSTKVATYSLMKLLQKPVLIVPQDGPKKITIEQFSTTVKWFGCFFNTSRGSLILDEMVRLNEKLWFHGFIDRSTAERRLYQRDVGTFLVRLSVGSDEYPFTFSIMCKGSEGKNVIQHKRVKHKAGEPSYLFPISKTKTKAFSSLQAIIDESKSECRDACPEEELQNPYLTTYLDK